MLILLFGVCATSVQTSAFSEKKIVCIAGLELNMELAVCD